MDFAVQVDGEEQGRWVLAVDGDRLLIADDNSKRLRWVAMADCKFVRAANPEMPRPMVLVQPQAAQAAQKIALPQLHIGNGKVR